MLRANEIRSNARSGEGPRDAGALDAISSRLAELHVSACETLSSLTHTAERVLGSLPESGDEVNGVGNPPNGQINGLERQIAAVADVLSALGEQAKRLAQL